MQVDNITTEFVLDDAPDRGRATVMQLTWCRGDPFAVIIELISRPEHPALPHGVWVAPRDALRTGLDTPVGDGDVRITPGTDRTIDGGHVRFDLNDGHRQNVVVTVRAASLRAFLDRTERIVASGEEHPEKELDDVLHELLQQT